MSPAVEQVRTGTALQGVVTVLTEECLALRAEEEAFVAGRETVIADTAIERVDTSPAGERIVAAVAVAQIAPRPAE